MAERDHTVEGSLATWYRQEYPKVYRALLVLTGSPAEARDLTDEAFTRAVERWARVSRMASPGAWVQTVAINLVRRSRRVPQPLPLAERASVGHETAEPSMFDVDLQHAISQLSLRKRQAIVCRYVLDQTESETAKTLGIASGTAARLLHEARNELRHNLDVPTAETQR